MNIVFTLESIDCEVETKQTLGHEPSATLFLPRCWDAIRACIHPPVQIVFDLDAFTCELAVRMHPDKQPTDCVLHLPKAWKSMQTLVPNDFLMVGKRIPIFVDDKYEEEIEPIKRRKRLHRSSSQKTQTQSEEHIEGEYSVALDMTQWESLDKVPYLSVETKRDKMLFLDIHGSQVKEDDVDSIEFLVTPNGEVCCIHGERFGMFAYLEGANTKYAPGKPRQLVMADGELSIDIEWFKPANDLPSRSQLPSSLEELFLTKHFSLPASAFCANLAHLTDATCLKWMSDYYMPLRCFRQVFPRVRLGMWALETDLKFARQETQADMLDLLELYYIKSAWIWRCTLGEYIWSHFIQSVVDFGGKPKLGLVEQLLNARLCEGGECPMWNRDKCEVCGKVDVLKHFIKIDDFLMGVGFVCLSRMRYIFNIGDRIRNFRKKLTFDVLDAQTLVSDLRTLQLAHQDQEEHFKLSFSVQ